MEKMAVQKLKMEQIEKDKKEILLLDARNYEQSGGTAPALASYLVSEKIYEYFSLHATYNKMDENTFD